MKHFFRLYLLIFMAMGFTGCATTGVYSLEQQVRTSDQRVMSETQAAEIVNQALKDQNITYQQTTQNAWIDQILTRLSRAAGSHTPFHARVYQSKDANAFSIGGKYVFVSTGIIEMFQNDDNLMAGVLGHEIAHDIAGHHVRQATAAQWQQAAVNLLKKQTNNNKTVGMVADISNTLISLKYSRSQEKESDILGTLWAYRAGYDPLGLIRFFEKTNSSMNSNRLVTLLSSHPMHPSRIQTVQTVSRYVRGELSLPQIRTLDPSIAKVLESVQNLDTYQKNISASTNTTRGLTRY